MVAKLPVLEPGYRIVEASAVARARTAAAGQIEPPNLVQVCHLSLSPFKRIYFVSVSSPVYAKRARENLLDRSGEQMLLAVRRPQILAGLGRSARVGLCVPLLVERRHGLRADAGALA